MEELKNILQFIAEIEKVKGLHRKTRPVGLCRYENSAEHSWSVILSAFMLKDYANEEINTERVIKMLLLYDLSEIDGDCRFNSNGEFQELSDYEASSLERVLNILPENTANEYMLLLEELQAGDTADAKYARAIYRLPPLLHNLHGNGHGWKENSIPKEKVFSVNHLINEGSEKLWQVMESRLQEAVARGILK